MRLTRKKKANNNKNIPKEKIVVFLSLEKLAEIIKDHEKRMELPTLDDDLIGLVPVYSFGFKFKKQLKENSDIKLTRSYLTDDSITLQCYALEVLLEQEKESVFKILIELLQYHKDDDVYYNSGCNLFKQKLKIYLYLKIKAKLTNEEQIRIENTFGSL